MLFVNSTDVGNGLFFFTSLREFFQIQMYYIVFIFSVPVKTSFRILNSYNKGLLTAFHFFQGSLLPGIPNSKAYFSNYYSNAIIRNCKIIIVLRVLRLMTVSLVKIAVFLLLLTALSKLHSTTLTSSV